MSFFIRNKGTNYTPRKRKTKASNNKVIGSTSKKSNLTVGSAGEEIPSDDEDIDGNVPELSSSEDEETAQEKRVKLAKIYLEEIEKEEKERAETNEIDKEVIAHRLKEDVLEQAGKLQRKVADELEGPDSDNIKILRGHKQTVTCVVISSDDKFVISGSKDCSIIKWCFQSGKRLKTIPGGRKGSEEHHVGHTSHILSLALSSDNKFLASGCYNKVIKIWSPDTMQHIHDFNGHRGAISGLVFRKGFHQLYSVSHDRSVKVWNLEEMAYVETLFGHHSSITSVDSLTRERAISSGGSDNSIRVWKIVEESQLVFQGHKRSIDCVRLINEEHFVSSSDDGSLAVWGVLKKKPLTLVENVHGVSNDEPNWISSVTTLQNTDVIASGSKDGNVNVWKCAPNFKSLTKIFSIPVPGFVNALQFSKTGSHLIAGVGQEHRLGRWWNLKKTKNFIYIVPIKKKVDS